MIFASDLDRTLIYSKRAMMDFPPKEPVDSVPVEFKAENEVSFMTREALDYLQQIAAGILFVPVTTRSLEQYQRVSFPFSCEYAVTTNGATILHHGEPLVEWEQKRNQHVEGSAIALEDLLDELKTVCEFQGRLRVVEELFAYYTLNELPSKAFVKELDGALQNKGWRVSLQGRKLYFMPKAVSKGNAIQYIQEREGIATLIGAGDSRFDDDFLQHCQFPFVLGHGELAKMGNMKEHYHMINQVGIKGGEELLRLVLKLVHANE